MEQPQQNKPENKETGTAERLIAAYDNIKRDDPAYEQQLVELAKSVTQLYSSEFPDELPMHADAPAAVQAALDLVFKLRDGVLTREYSPEIETVVVLGGGGTFATRLKGGEPEWLRWSDRDRIKAGIAVAREVTRSRLAKTSPRTDQHLTDEQLMTQGPMLVYPGNAIENAALREAITAGEISYPSEKIRIIDTVSYPEGEGTIGIRHTADQIKVVFDDLSEYKNIAVVQHIPDFVRTPFYIEHEKEKRGQTKEHAFWAYALQGRRGSSQGLREDTLGSHLLWEFQRLIRYVKRGHLATKPVRLENFPE